jgi:pyrroloquinoline quinone biosynthesis protein D
MNSVYRLGDDVSFEPVGEGAVILLLGSGQLYSCNESSLSFLRHLDGVRSVADVARRMADEFDIDAATLADDLPELIADLVAEGIIVHAA